MEKSDPIQKVEKPFETFISEQKGKHTYIVFLTNTLQFNTKLVKLVCGLQNVTLPDLLK